MENEQSWGGEEGKCVGGVQKYVNNNNISKMSEADQRVARILCIRATYVQSVHGIMVFVRLFVRLRFESFPCLPASYGGQHWQSPVPISP